MTPIPPAPDSANDKKKRRVEDLFIILCILSLWPVILGWRAPVYEYLLYIALIGLIIVFVRRVKRLRQTNDRLGGNP